MKHTAHTILAGIPLLPSVAAAENPGLPQMDTSTFASQLFWLFVCFVFLYVVMVKVSLPRVGGTIDARRNMREGSLEQAEAWNTEAEKVKAEYEASLSKAQKTAAANTAVAERALSAKISDEQSKFAENTRKRLADAEKNIAKAKADALGSLSAIAAEIAAEMAEKVAGVSVSKADAQKAVAAAMKEG
jgi:F-type H+-transporting ATPase subunit b